MSRLRNYLLVITILVFTTACSGKVKIPDPPELSGNCHEDLYKVLQYYVVPMEEQR